MHRDGWSVLICHMFSSTLNYVELPRYFLLLLLLLLVVVVVVVVVGSRSNGPMKIWGGLESQQLLLSISRPQVMTRDGPLQVLALGANGLGSKTDHIETLVFPGKACFNNLQEVSSIWRVAGTKDGSFTSASQSPLSFNPRSKILTEEHVESTCRGCPRSICTTSSVWLEFRCSRSLVGSIPNWTLWMPRTTEGSNVPTVKITGTWGQF